MLQLNIWLLNKSISMELFLIKYGKECTLLYILSSFSSTSHVQHRETWQPFLQGNINNRVPLNGTVKDGVWWQSEVLKGKCSLSPSFIFLLTDYLLSWACTLNRILTCSTIADCILNPKGQLSDVRKQPWGIISHLHVVLKTAFLTSVLKQDIDWCSIFISL